MPTYEYACDCGHRFELLRKMSDPPWADCPACGARAPRIISAGAAVRSGSGDRGEPPHAPPDPSAPR